jgi:hypothetical protein
MARKPKQDLDQKRTALHYGALRDAIGKPGRHGAKVVLLTPPPKLAPFHGGHKLTIAGLPPPPAATDVVLYDGAGTPLGPPRKVSKKGSVSVGLGAGVTVAWVEV